MNFVENDKLNLDYVACISYSPLTLGKGKNPTILPQASVVNCRVD